MNKALIGCFFWVIIIKIKKLFTKEPNAGGSPVKEMDAIKTV